MSTPRQTLTPLSVLVIKTAFQENQFKSGVISKNLLGSFLFLFLEEGISPRITGSFLT